MLPQIKYGDYICYGYKKVCNVNSFYDNHFSKLMLDDDIEIKKETCKNIDAKFKEFNDIKVAVLMIFFFGAQIHKIGIFASH